MQPHLILFLAIASSIAPSFGEEKSILERRNEINQARLRTSDREERAQLRQAMEECAASIQPVERVALSETVLRLVLEPFPCPTVVDSQVIGQPESLPEDLFPSSMDSALRQTIETLASALREMAVTHFYWDWIGLPNEKRNHRMDPALTRTAGRIASPFLRSVWQSYRNQMGQGAGQASRAEKIILWQAFVDKFDREKGWADLAVKVLLEDRELYREAKKFLDPNFLADRVRFIEQELLAEILLVYQYGFPPDWGLRQVFSLANQAIERTGEDLRIDDEDVFPVIEWWVKRETIRLDQLWQPNQSDRLQAAFQLVSANPTIDISDHHIADSLPPKIVSRVERKFPGVDFPRVITWALDRIQSSPIFETFFLIYFEASVH